MLITLLIFGGLCLGHLLNWLFTKGTIWVMFELFNVNWYGKFWVVYVALLILLHIFKSININKS